MLSRLACFSHAPQLRRRLADAGGVFQFDLHEGFVSSDDEAALLADIQKLLGRSACVLGCSRVVDAPATILACTHAGDGTTLGTGTVSSKAYVVRCITVRAVALLWRPPSALCAVPRSFEKLS
jgi:hypothetical protein